MSQEKFPSKITPAKVWWCAETESYLEVTMDC